MISFLYLSFVTTTQIVMKSRRCRSSRWKLLQGAARWFKCNYTLHICFAQQSLKVFMYRKWQKLMRRRKNKVTEVGVYSGAVIGNKMWCQSRCSSRVSSIWTTCVGAEALRAFSEPNHALQALLSLPALSLNAPVRSVTVSNLRLSLPPPAFSPLVHQSIRPASRSTKLDWH